MRKQFLAFVVCVATAVGIFSTSAFSAAQTGARTVTVDVVGDASAYLALSAGTTNTNFVDTSGAKLQVDFDDPDGAGTIGAGVNVASTYYFDDIIKITNQGPNTVYLQATGDTASSPAGVEVEVCYQASTGAMTNGCYADSHPASPTALASGASAYLGLKTIETGGSTGTDFTLEISITASRS